MQFPRAIRRSKNANVRKPPQILDRSRVAQTAPLMGGPRIVALFGPPGVGVTTMCRVLKAESHTPITVLVPDFGDLAEQIERIADTERPSVVFLDGFPRCEEGVRYLHEKGLLDGGALIRVHAFPQAIIKRSRATPGGVDKFFRGDAKTGEGGLEAIERRIHELDMPYFVVQNDDLHQALCDVARRIGLED